MASVNTHFHRLSLTGVAEPASVTSLVLGAKWRSILFCWQNNVIIATWSGTVSLTEKMDGENKLIGFLSPMILQTCINLVKCGERPG